MRKEEYIQRYGGVAFERMREQTKVWNAAHPKRVKEIRQVWAVSHPGECKVFDKKWREANPDKVKARNQEYSCKGGKYYAQTVEYKRTGLQGERNIIRRAHRYKWNPYKQIIAPSSQIHHAWLPGTPKYRGVALVEADQHRHGIIDVIEVLEGEITLFTEKEIREQGRGDVNTNKSIRG